MIKHACPEILNTKHQSPLSLIPSLISIIRLQDLLRMCLVLPKKQLQKHAHCQHKNIVSTILILCFKPQQFVSKHRFCPPFLPGFGVPNLNSPQAPSCARRSAGLNCKNFTKYICNYDMYIAVYTDFVYTYIYIALMYICCMQRCYRDAYMPWATIHWNSQPQQNTWELLNLPGSEASLPLLESPNPCMVCSISASCPSKMENGHVRMFLMIESYQIHDVWHTLSCQYFEVTLCFQNFFSRSKAIYFCGNWPTTEMAGLLEKAKHNQTILTHHRDRLQNRDSLGHQAVSVLEPPRWETNTKNTQNIKHIFILKIPFPLVAHNCLYHQLHPPATPAQPS